MRVTAIYRWNIAPVSFQEPGNASTFRPAVATFEAPKQHSTTTAERFQMVTTATRPFRADHVGSLLRPPELLRGRARFADGKIGAEELRGIENDTIRQAIQMQEDAGLPVVTDGEFRRTFWHLDFLTSFANVERVAPKVKARFHTHAGDLELEAPGIRVTGKLSRPHPIFVDAFRFVDSVAKSAAKVTIPSPTI